MIRDVYEKARQAKIISSQVYTTNYSLKSFEKGTSWTRRVKWFPMNYKPDKIDPLFITKLTTPQALSYWVKLLVEASIDLYHNGFHQSSKIDDFTMSQNLDNDSLARYEFDNNFERESFINEPVKDAYDAYQAWCDENDVTSRSKNVFRQKIMNRFGLGVATKTVGGKSLSRFLEADEAMEILKARKEKREKSTKRDKGDE